MEPRIQVTPLPRNNLNRSLLVFVVLVCVDFLSIVFFPSSTEDLPSWGQVLGLIAVTALPWFAFATIAAFCGRPWLYLASMTIGFFLGQALSSGHFAATLALAAMWKYLAAAATLLAVWVLHFWSSRPQLFGAKLFSYAVIALMIASALFLERGRYHLVRQCVFALAAIGLYVSLQNFAWRPAKIFSQLLLVAIFFAACFGVYLTHNNQVIFQWGRNHCVLASPYLVSIRIHLANDLDEGDLEDHGPRLVGVHETPLGKECLARLDALESPPQGFLFITIDAMRADLIGNQVGDRIVTPFLNEKAQSGAYFERCYAPAPLTQFSFFSFLSGWYPSQYLSHLGGFEDTPLITEKLNSAGVETRGCYAKGIFTLSDENFERHALGFESSSLQDWDDLDLEATFSQLKPQGAGPWFSYLHLMLPHAPYNGARAEFQSGDSRFEKYAAEVRQADDFVKKLVGKFAQAGLAKNTWFVVSADHGEEFEEHGALKHGTQVFEESVRVPLIAWGPGIAAQAPSTAPISLVDLAPSLHHFFRLPHRDHGYAGRSWLPLFLGLSDDQRNPAILVENPPVSMAKWNARSAIVEEDWKLIADERTKSFMLFDLKRDPGETKNLVDTNDSEFQRLWNQLRLMRRFPGVDQHNIFSEMEDVEEFFLVAERQGPAHILGYLEVMLDVPIALKKRYLAYFFDHHDSRIAKTLQRLFAAHEDAEIAWASHTITAIASSTITAQTDQELLKAFETLENPYLISTWSEWLRIHKPKLKIDPKVFEVSDPIDATAKLQLDLASALTLAQASERQAQGPAVRDLALRALNSPSFWVRERGLDLVAILKSALPLETLEEVYADTELASLRIRVARCLERLSPEQNDALLRRALFDAEAQVRQTAFYSLASLPQDLPGTNTLKVSDPRFTAKAQGFRALLPRLALGHQREMTLPFDSSADDRLLALFIDIPYLAGDQNYVEISCGSFKLRLRTTSGSVAKATLIEIPGGLEADTIQLSWQRNDPPQLQFAGYSWIEIPKGALPLAKTR